MPAPPISILRAGLVTSVGLSAPAACAAIRAKLSNPTKTRFIDSQGEWIAAHEVTLGRPWRGFEKLGKMAKMAIAECLADTPREQWHDLPLLLCVAEPQRPGRFEGLDDRLLLDVQQELGVRFASGSRVVAKGRASLGRALIQARQLVYGQNRRNVLIAAADTHLTWPTLREYEANGRLLTSTVSNGFIPGEGACALLTGRPTGRPELLCSGVGLGLESAHIDSEEPLRADGLTQAMKAALTDAGCEIHDLDFRVADLSGEQYYFKEAALAISRILRRRKDEFDVWHPAESIGECGAVAGLAMIAVAEAGCRKHYVPGYRILAHMANDCGERAAAVLHFKAV